ncbi:hypothetical protein SAMN03080615_03509 [Amphritea atlantica]|uniref:Uncharacterized protein n=1 Tax=Amphritea atlantica TaxID=355243 RepID=A0A1H9KHV7_9GAMM|nr:hypothetical protein SAMN03080615_03509 [Amphritea atlantica]
MTGQGFRLSIDEQKEEDKQYIEKACKKSQRKTSCSDKAPLYL